MKNKKGFAIIETIIVVVMMTTSLLLVYASYNSSIRNEKKRVYYDDVVDIYKIHDLKNYILKESNLDAFIEESFCTSSDVSNYTNKNKSLVRNIGSETGNLFLDTSYLNELLKFYNMEKLIILKTDYEAISACSYKVIKSDVAFADGTAESLCMNSFQNFTYEEIDYIKSLGSNIKFNKNDFILIAVFKTSIKKQYTYSYINLRGE